MNKIEGKNKCPCGSELSFEQCCQPFISGSKLAQNAEQLMRSRYSAYATQAVDYIYQTQAPATREQNLKQDIQTFAQQSKFVQLTVHEHKILSDQQQQVAFTAIYRVENQFHLLKELSDFVYLQGRWYYQSGLSEFQTLKLGRNDPCPCLSGKKFKKCCGAA
ncbi:hypothetical protein DS2_01010 [Catenovulum agarivorans DS-2]|uniref:YchJ-like middle NTF2-like domain-containing protein n=1 Tax=Catenovulum agarivorans DS-2 TaxID=1328313 RepID=W7QT92_9ALTE|nr:YchJ family protein [Catenovulum agarivorans]EWH12257.1 hypothetical protein DS2_01010 [Catenovulum agarivorans DS-2]